MKAEVALLHINTVVSIIETKDQEERIAFDNHLKTVVKQWKIDGGSIGTTEDPMPCQLKDIILFFTIKTFGKSSRNYCEVKNYIKSLQ